ncbi:MAG: thiamine phosphate synthase [Pacificimonas sp.]
MFTHAPRYNGAMRPRNTRKLPTRWLFTDERMEADLDAALTKLRRGDGVVFRHYGAPNREALARRVARIAKRSGLVLVVAGDDKLSRRLGAAGTHMPGFARQHRPLTAAAHGHADIVRARRAGAQLVFLSPIFRTRSHADAKTLGPVRFGLIARGAGVAVAGLGGMNAARFSSLRQVGAKAWGAIDAFS